MSVLSSSSVDDVIMPSPERPKSHLSKVACRGRFSRNNEPESSYFEEAILNELPDQKDLPTQTLPKKRRKSDLPVYKPELDEKSQADFNMFLRYESMQEPTIFELAELFNKLNKHFLPKVHDPQKSRQLLESDYPIPRCYAKLVETFTKLELALFHMLEHGIKPTYTSIRARIFEQTRL